MWFDPPGIGCDWSNAAEHLSRADRILARVIRRVGPCTLTRRRDYFPALCKAIFSQQLSTKVAATLFSRFRDLFPGRRPTAQRLLHRLNGNEEMLKRCGLSRQKAAYLRDLAEHFHNQRIPTGKLSKMTDEQVIEALVAVKGIGRWTAEMFLIFVLNRPDVLPVDDLGLREGVREIYGLERRPTATELMELGEKWRPYRTLATWYVWRRSSTSNSAVAARPSSTRPVGSAPTRRRSAPARHPS